LVIFGAPNDLLMITFLPLGPKVTFTALANASTPLFRPSLASISNFISFAIFVIIFFEGFKLYALGLMFVNLISFIFQNKTERDLLCSFFVVWNFPCI